MVCSTHLNGAITHRLYISTSQVTPVVVASPIVLAPTAELEDSDICVCLHVRS